MNSLCHTVTQHLEAGTPLVLATMMDTRGSAPRAAGARMLVLPDGSIEGTVGGGRYEAESIAAAVELHKLCRALTEKNGLPAPGTPLPGRPGLVLEFSLRGVTDMDMVCGGSLSLLLEYLPAHGPVRAVFAAGLEAEKAGQPFTFISRFFPDVTAEAFAESSDGLRIESGTFRRARVERFTLLPQSLMTVPPGAALPEAVLREAAAVTGEIPSRLNHDGQEYLLEPFARPFRLIIFGGGHVAVDVADLARSVDFHVTVTDDRPEFVAPERFPGACTELSPSLNQQDSATLLARLALTSSDGVVIVTRGHAHDRDVLAAALETKAGYIGMIGSKSKRATVYADLQKSGVSREQLEAVYSPIGLAIGAQTPREIGVSIVAELIQWRQCERAGQTEQAGARKA